MPFGSDPSFLGEVTHRLKVATKKVIGSPVDIYDALKKLNLKALWIPDSKKILIDSDVPDLKHRWIEGHEISHSIIPWHTDFIFGDNKQTLSPTCDEIIEAEANYSAGRLLFLGDIFVSEAREVELNFNSIKRLKGKYGNTITTTLWRLVESRNVEEAVFGMISCHPKHPEIGNTEERFIRSLGFRQKFHNIVPNDIFSLLAKHASYNRTGPILSEEVALSDANGDIHRFLIESFSNSYDLLTLGYRVGKQNTNIIF